MKSIGGRTLLSYDERMAQRRAGYKDELGLSGHTILDQGRDRWMKRWVCFPGERAADFHTLWAMHTHFKRAKQLIWPATPRAYYLSEKEASGKSTALEELNLVCADTFGLDLDPTQYGLQYALSQDGATVLLDEGDVSAIANPTIAIINAGYTPNGQVLNGRGMKANRVKVFGPIAMGALDDIKTGPRSKKIRVMLSRGFQIHMEPGPHEKWCAETIRKGAVVKRAFAWWADVAMNNGINMEPEMPDWMEYRQAQIMQPFFTIAEAAGGDWTDRMWEHTKVNTEFYDEFMAL